MRMVKIEQPNCAPCALVSQYLDSRNASYQTVDATEKPDVAGSYGVMSVPVTILLDDESNEVQRSVGFKPDELSAIIEKLNEWGRSNGIT